MASYPTSYIPTNGQAETRLADICQGGGDESTFNDSEGVVYGEISGFDVDSTSKVIALTSGVLDNSVAIFYYQSTVRLSITNSGSVQAYITHNLSDVKDTIKFAIKYNTNDIGFWVNGVEVGTDTTATPPTGLNKINFDRYDGGNKFYGKVKALHYFPEALTDTELQQLTSNT